MSTAVGPASALRIEGHAVVKPRESIELLMLGARKSSCHCLGTSHALRGAGDKHASVTPEGEVDSIFSLSERKVLSHLLLQQGLDAELP